MRIRRLVAVPATAALAVGLLGACNDTAPTEEPGDTMEEDSMEEDSMDDDTMDDDTMEDDTMDDDTMEDEG